MTASKQVLGSHGESIAETFLRRKGHAVLARNYRDPVSRCEIDLITRDGDELVFVEVKAGTGHRFGDPHSWVDGRKQRHIARTARRFLQERNWYETPCRYDVIGIDLSQNPPGVTHLEHAFWSAV
ncbi:MAG: YraN family protein [Gemmatimonadetes bacterium]|nr:YraN family protein [Gemmatimonadota bacterium]MYG84958.1 YraN family protein [Gemmatimonadota bacterium]MYJ90500.1 YraN family protein [Gemmatimonadota bacterium]